MSKAHAIEDLHSRLKTNVETIQQLNQQVPTNTMQERDVCHVENVVLVLYSQ